MVFVIAHSLPFSFYRIFSPLFLYVYYCFLGDRAHCYNRYYYVFIANNHNDAITIIIIIMIVLCRSW